MNPASMNLSTKLGQPQAVDHEPMIIKPVGIIVTYLRGDRALVTGG